MATFIDNDRDNDILVNENFSDEKSSLAEQIDLQHYFRILRKHKWAITFFTAAVTALAAYYAYTATPVYSSTSTLLIEEQTRSNMPQLEELLGLESNNTDYYETQFELLKSRTLAIRVVETLNLWNDPELSNVAQEAVLKQTAAKQNTLGEEPENLLSKFRAIFEKFPSNFSANEQRETKVVVQPLTALETSSAIELPGEIGQENTVSHASDSIQSTQAIQSSAGESVASTEQMSIDQETVIARFMSKLTIAPIRKTKLVKITYESANPSHAALVANTVGEQYIESYLDSKMELTTKASSWLTDRLANLKVKLDESKERLITFQKTNGLIDLDGGIGQLDQQELLLLTTELAQAESDLNNRADVYREVRDLSGNPALLETVPSIQSDVLVQASKIEKGVAQRQLDELRNRYGERHPRVVDATSQLNTINRTLEEHMIRVVASIEKDYKFSQQRVASIRGKINAGKAKYQVLGSKKFELDALQREVSTNQDIYDTFFNRISEANSADGLITANAVISDMAVASTIPVKPKKQIIIALATLASLVISMLMAFLYEQMDDTIKATHDVESKLGVKLLGILPIVKGGLFNRTAKLPLNPVEINDKKGTFAEAINTVRTALSLDENNGPTKVILVTSSVPSEGKSTASINIAYSMAQLERVLLIDCDLRRPTVATASNLEKKAPGLSNLITGSATAKECIHRDVFNGYVDVIPSGPIPDQPLELLSSRRFENIVEQLSEHYDRIIIDCAPTQAVSDALVLSKLSDAVVYAVKSHDTPIELINRGLSRLKQVNAPIAGILVTQVDVEKLASYGGDYYYQGYYDYYGYQESGTGKKQSDKLRLSKEEMLAIRNDDQFQLNLNPIHDLKNIAGRDKETSYAAKQVVSARLSRKSKPEPKLVNEFDLTTQIDSANGEKHPSDANNATPRQRVKFRDDLDII